MELTFTAPLERHAHGRAMITLVGVPDDESDLLNDLPVPRGGFGSIAVHATVGKTVWRTSVFPDKERFLLLIARKLTMAEGLEVGAGVTVTLNVIGL